MSRSPAKVDIARDHVWRVSPWSEVAALRTDVCNLTPGAFAEVDVVVLAFDNFGARFLASRALHAARRVHIDVAANSDYWMARASICDPSSLAAGAACIVCAWSSDQLARAGEDGGVPCAAPTQPDAPGGAAFASTLPLAHRTATLASREVMALSRAVRLPASVGQELRDDLAGLRIEACPVHARADCPSDHALARGPLVTLDRAPADLTLGELGERCGLRPEDRLVRARGEWVATAACRGCADVSWPISDIGTPLAPCGACGAERVAVRRTRSVSWGDVADAVRGQRADSWFAPGDAFAVDGAPASRCRTFQFPAPALEWRRERAWRDSDEARFARLPAGFDHARIRQTRIGLLGLGHVGAAVLHELAPLGFGGWLLVDKDDFAPHNLPAHALGASVPTLESDALHAQEAMA